MATCKQAKQVKLQTRETGVVTCKLAKCRLDPLIPLFFIPTEMQTGLMSKAVLSRQKVILRMVIESPQQLGTHKPPTIYQFT
jgi:hypothetical protein